MNTPTNSGPAPQPQSPAATPSPAPAPSTGTANSGEVIHPPKGPAHTMRLTEWEDSVRETLKANQGGFKDARPSQLQILRNAMAGHLRALDQIIADRRADHRQEAENEERAYRKASQEGEDDQPTPVDIIPPGHYAPAPVVPAFVPAPPMPQPMPYPPYGPQPGRRTPWG